MSKNKLNKLEKFKTHPVTVIFMCALWLIFIFIGFDALYSILNFLLPFVGTYMPIEIFGAIFVISLIVGVAYMYNYEDDE